MLISPFKTRRLEIRSIEVEDYKASVGARALSLPSANELHGELLAISVRSREEFGRLVSYRLDQALEDRSYHFGVFVAATGELAGEVILYDVLRGNRQMASIGAITYSAHRRQGIAGEALSALVRIGFRRLGLHRIEGQARPDNAISIRLCRAVGFREEGMSVGRFKEAGRWRDALIFAMVRGRDG